MKLILFACAIWTGTYIDPSDGVHYGPIILFRHKRHRQETTYEVTCRGKCIFRDIRTKYGTGMTLVRGYNDEEETDQFCTSDWSLGSGPGNTGASSQDQICKFNGKPAKGRFFLKLKCVNWKNTTQGCQSARLYPSVDGVVSLKKYNDNQWDLKNMAHGETDTYKAVCNKNQCKIGGIVMTLSETGIVEINTYKENDDGGWEDICKSNPGTVHCQDVLDTGFYPKTGPFFIKATCNNLVNKAQGCQHVAVTMTSGNVQNVHGPLN